MPIRLTFLYSLFGIFVFAQKPNSQDKAYLANDTIIVLGEDYMLKTILNISTSVIIEVKDKNDHRVTLYKIDPTFFKR
jgi:hypothetical protein